MLTLTLASTIFCTSCYLHKWLTLNIKKTRQFRENQRKAGRQAGRQAALHDILLDVFHCGDSDNRFVDKTVVTAILVTCVVVQEM